jgi:diaminohydroxyphosphoribosylaminopyrimidine deaminase/5-amino-6-(5-phosphoribosylamino)uracil reductase
VERKRPWLIAKWAMSLDGRVATAAGASRWISSEASREIVHALRGRMDGILCGIGTALADDPLLTARPAGPRQPLRIVLDGTARLPLESRLVRTARETPLLVATGPSAPADRLRQLEAAGCEIWQCLAASPQQRLESLLAELGSRRLTNVLVEGGPTVLGSLADAQAIDEVWAFIAPMIIGGEAAPAPVGGTGITTLASAVSIEIEHVAHPGGDLLVRGVVRGT